jgi:hypothetical protein
MVGDLMAAISRNAARILPEIQAICMIAGLCTRQDQSKPRNRDWINFCCSSLPAVPMGVARA